MSMSDEGADVVGPGADATAGQGGPPAGPPGGGGGPPGGGGPIMAALARSRQGPQPSAPGPGDQAKGMQFLMQAVGYIEQALPHLPKESPMYRDALQAATRLSRHASQGQPTAGVQATGAQDMIRNIMRNALLQRIMGQQGRGQQPGAAGAGQPSTPLPGA